MSMRPMALHGGAYNTLFLVYVALFASSLFAFVLTFMSIDLTSLPQHFSTRPSSPRPGALHVIAGLVTLVVWLAPLLGALIQGQPPARIARRPRWLRMRSNLGLIVPSTFLAAF